MTVAAEERLTLTVEQAAQRLGIGRSLAYGMVARGELPSVKLGRLRRVPVAALEDWLREQSAPTGHFQALGR